MFPGPELCNCELIFRNCVSLWAARLLIRPFNSQHKEVHRSFAGSHTRFLGGNLVFPGHPMLHLRTSLATQIGVLRLELCHACSHERLFSSPFELINLVYSPKNIQIVPSFSKFVGNPENSLTGFDRYFEVGSENHGWCSATSRHKRPVHQQPLRPK